MSPDAEHDPEHGPSLHRRLLLRWPEATRRFHASMHHLSGRAINHFLAKMTEAAKKNRTSNQRGMKIRPTGPPPVPRVDRVSLI